MATNQTDSAQKLTLAVAEEIRVWMTRRRMSGERLARELGVSSAWVSYRINGQVDLKLGELVKIATALDVEVAQLLPAPARRGAIMEPSPRPAVRTSTRLAHPVDPRPDRPRTGRRNAPRTGRPVWTHAGVTT